MTNKQEQELLASVEELKLQQAKSDAHAEDQARTIMQQNQRLLQQRKQQDREGVAWENIDPNKNYDYFGSFTIEGVEYGICLANTWKNSDRLIKSKSGKKGQRLSVFKFKQKKEDADKQYDAAHAEDEEPFKYNQVPDNDAENGRYDDVVVNKDHSINDGDKPTHERGE